MSQVVAMLEAKLLPAFENLAQRITNDFPLVMTRAHSGCSSDNAFICVRCILKNASFPENDKVSLCIHLTCLQTEPQITAYVVWGNSHVEAEFHYDWLVVSDRVIRHLEKDLPRLSAALIEAVRRKEPLDEENNTFYDGWASNH
jgi:hypothetical protein